MRVAFGTVYFLKAADFLALVEESIGAEEMLAIYCGLLNSAVSTLSI